MKISRIIKNILKSDCTEIIGRTITLSYDSEDYKLEASYTCLSDVFYIDSLWIGEEEHILSENQKNVVGRFLSNKLEVELGMADEMERGCSLVVNGWVVN